MSLTKQKFVAPFCQFLILILFSMIGLHAQASPLVEAVQARNLERVRSLLEIGSLHPNFDVNFKDRHEVNTALGEALFGAWGKSHRSKFQDIVRLFFKYPAQVNIDYVSDDEHVFDKSLLYYALWMGEDAFLYFLNRGVELDRIHAPTTDNPSGSTLLLLLEDTTQVSGYGIGRLEMAIAYGANVDDNAVHQFVASLPAKLRNREGSFFDDELRALAEQVIAIFSDIDGFRKEYWRTHQEEIEILKSFVKNSPTPSIRRVVRDKFYSYLQQLRDEDAEFLRPRFDSYNFSNTLLALSNRPELPLFDYLRDHLDTASKIELSRVSRGGHFNAYSMLYDEFRTSKFLTQDEKNRLSEGHSPEKIFFAYLKTKAALPAVYFEALK